MKLLDKYILKEFIRFLMITFISFIALFLIIDFFEKIKMFLSNKASLIQISSYFLFSIPMIISYVLPPAVLIATLMTFSSLSKYSEITAIKANGINIYRVTAPLLILAVILTVFLFYFSELIAPQSTQKSIHIIKVELRKKQNLGVLKQNEIWYHGESAIYNFKIFDMGKNILYGVTINNLNPDFTLKSRIDAKEAIWQNGHWLFKNLLMTRFDHNDNPVLEWSEGKIIQIPEKPEDFNVMQKGVEKMGYFDLRKYVKKIQSEGYDATRYLVDLHGKISFPFVVLIMVIIAVPFSLRSERSGGILQSLSIGIVVGFSYWVVHAFCMSLGKSEIIPALLAAWMANLLFATLAVFLFSKVVRT
jgi:lipopolysaccharide export system permease protein